MKKIYLLATLCAFSLQSNAYCGIDDLTDSEKFAHYSQQVKEYCEDTDKRSSKKAMRNFTDSMKYLSAFLEENGFDSDYNRSIQYLAQLPNNEKNIGLTVLYNEIKKFYKKGNNDSFDVNSIEYRDFIKSVNRKLISKNYPIAPFLLKGVIYLK